MTIATRQKKFGSKTWRKNQRRRNKHIGRGRSAHQVRLKSSAAVGEEDYYQGALIAPEEFINFRTQDISNSGQSLQATGDGRENNWDQPAGSVLEGEAPPSDNGNLIR